MPDTPIRMTVTGLCQICESEPAVHRCRLCGAMVCETHYVTGRGLCTECAAADPSE